MKIASSPGVTLKVISSSKGVERVSLALSASFYLETNPSEWTTALADWLYQYAKGQPQELPNAFCLKDLSDFDTAVLSYLNKSVLFGQTTTYKQLAIQINNPKACRAVGGSCNRNPYPLFYPCHRVIKSDQTAGGFAFEAEIKKRLLEHERGFVPLS